MGLLKAPTPAAASAISAAIPLNSLPPAALTKSNQTPWLENRTRVLGRWDNGFGGMALWLASKSVRGWRQVEKSEWIGHGHLT